MATLQETLDKVTELDTKVGGLITLFNGIKEQLDEVLAGNLTEEQQAKVDEIFAKAQEAAGEIDAALAANVP